MNIKKLFLEKNACYMAGKTFTPKGIMPHSTGANNSSLKRYVGPDDGLLGVNQHGNHWNVYHPGGKDIGAHAFVDKSGDGTCDTCGGKQVCVHGFIGKLADGSVATYQTLPWNYRGWHAGKNAGNDGYISFEICEDGLADAAYFAKVYQEAVELCAHLCTEYKFDPLADGVILCHSEGYKRGIASNHADVMHWFPKHGKSMDTFRAAVKAAMGSGAGDQTQTGEMYRVRKSWADSKTQVGAYSVLQNAKSIADDRKSEGYKVFDASGVVVYDPAAGISPEELTIENAIADGIITDRNHWLGVLTGIIAPNKGNIKTLMDNAHKEITKK